MVINVYVFILINKTENNVNEIIGELLCNCNIDNIFKLLLIES